MPDPTVRFSAEAISPAPFQALHEELLHQPSALRRAITDASRRDEREAVQWLLAQRPDAAPGTETPQALARALVQAVREKRAHASGVDALMHEFSLSSEEGVALMCLAEALLRIPDRATADRLIADKIGKGDWRRHLGESPSLFVNAATWGLVVTGKLVATSSEQGLASALTRLIAKGGEPLVRKGVDLAMRMLGDQFVAGRTIDEALAHGRRNEARGYRYSYDMLGEAALTEEDAARYYAAYENAIHAIGKAAGGRGIREGPGISVKLSALHPRYSRAQRARVMTELLPRLKQLTLLAQRYGIGLNIDAEEADRLELSLDLMEALAFDRDLAGFDGIGFVAQAYQKRCPFVIDYLVDLARRSGRRFMVRLVKGAYWDAEIKRAQVDGMPGYPVYTRKIHTDVSYLVCARKLLAAADAVYPQFATHNAHTLATVYAWAREQGVDDYEFQCLHGMGETLYDQVVGPENLDRPCRIYAPVGSHETLLAYLVRRLLENGANSSFVNQIVDEKVSVESLIADPFEAATALGGQPHPAIPLPSQLYGMERRNSAGVDLADENSLQRIDAAFRRFGLRQWVATPLLAHGSGGPGGPGVPQAVRNPADQRDVVGYVIEGDQNDADAALSAACAHAGAWNGTPASARADALERASDLFEMHRHELMALAIREAGKSLQNTVAEVREAVDFLRYYAARIRAQGGDAAALGPVVCISPWNFPLAIFIGQVSAALAAGNTVLAKPAEQTPLIAFRAVQLMHEAGVPRAALQFLPGRGETVGAALVADPRVRGVIFTGSTEVAQHINRKLAERAASESHHGIEPCVLVAETGGQNAMIVDSSALPEQVVQDVIVSAFDSAGQRCSALRVLCLQEEIADRILTMLEGAMRQLNIGPTDRLSVDIGPVIDAQARQNLLRHIEEMRGRGKRIFQLPLPAGCAQGTFVAPAVIEIADMSELRQEVFGPVLHVLRYRRPQLPALLAAIDATGYGLTLGIHSRIDETIDFIASHARVGNIYVNRNMVGAVVGVQPFGGEGKSGTGPKAGGPHYLMRLQRDAVFTQPTVSAAAPVGAALAGLLEWAAAHGHARTVAAGERHAHVNPLGACLVLAGPTGERNTLSFAPRGLVFCRPVDTDSLLHQLAAVFATGNHAALDAEGAALAVDLPPSVLGAIRFVEHVRDGDIRLALAERTLAARLMEELAERCGPEDALVPVIATGAADEIPLWRLLAERALCVNTAAAGGNASLMSLRS